MPNILVLGATGYIGLPLCLSLLRSGNHSVWGTARSADKASLLSAHEITPVLLDLSAPSSLLPILSSAPIDFIVNASSAYADDGPILSTILTFARERQARLEAEGLGRASKLGFVYVSGTSLHGETEPGSTSDLHPIGSASTSKGTPPERSSWRVGFEQEVLKASDVLDVAIVRPSGVYGRKGWIWGMWWGPLADAKERELQGEVVPVKMPVNKGVRMPVVHVDDVASGIHAVVDRIGGGLGSWPVFDLIAENVNVDELLERSREIMDLKGELSKVGPDQDGLLAIMSMRQGISDSERARILLGWVAKRRGFIMKLPLYIQAWKEGRREGNPLKAHQASAAGTSQANRQAW